MKRGQRFLALSPCSSNVELALAISRPFFIPDFTFDVAGLLALIDDFALGAQERAPDGPEKLTLSSTVAKDAWAARRCRSHAHRRVGDRRGCHRGALLSDWHVAVLFARRQRRVPLSFSVTLKPISSPLERESLPLFHPRPISHSKSSREIQEKC